MLALARVAYTDHAKRRDLMVLAEYFTDVLYNPLIMEDVARDSPGTLDDAFTSARSSESLLKRLGQLGEKRELRTVDPRDRLKMCYECGRWGHIRMR